MKILLDAMMPKEIGEFLAGHEVTHVADLGWRHLSNGELLAGGEAKGFEVLITKDANMPHHQNLEGRRICLVVVKPRSQDRNDLFARAPQIQRLLPRLDPGSVTRVTTSSGDVANGQDG